jgi:acyl carrier protein
MVGAMFAAGCTGGAGGPATTTTTSTTTAGSTSTTTAISTAASTSTTTATATSTSTTTTTEAAPNSKEEEIFVKVRNIVAHEVDMKPESLTRQSRFVEDLKTDDLTKVHIHLALEQAFDRDIPDGDFDKMKTLKDATAYLQSESKTPPPSAEVGEEE